MRRTSFPNLFGRDTQTRVEDEGVAVNPNLEPREEANDEAYSDIIPPYQNY